MPLIPIRVPRDPYRGSNANRRRKAAEFDRIAEKLEEHINREMAMSSETRHVFVYGELAFDLGLLQNQVRDALAGIGGDTGIAVWRGDGGA